MSAKFSRDKPPRTIRKDAAMFRLLLVLLIVPFGLAGGALGEPAKLRARPYDRPCPGRPC